MVEEESITVSTIRPDSVCEPWVQLCVVNSCLGLNGRSQADSSMVATDRDLWEEIQPN